MTHNPPNISTLGDSLNGFIQVNKDNQLKHNQRFDSLEALVKKVEMQVDHLGEHLQKEVRE